jgi:hypothetical protein
MVDIVEVTANERRDSGQFRLKEVKVRRQRQKIVQSEECFWRNPETKFSCD